jgi:hypothetical protein
MKVRFLVLSFAVSAAFMTHVCAAPIDTLQFGLLATGSSEQEVVSQVGEPDAKEDTTPRALHAFTGPNHSRIIIAPLKRETWVYRGDSVTLDSYLFFEGGKLKSKSKGR